MGNLPKININNTSFTLSDAQNLQKHLIEKLFTSSMVLQDRVYETMLCSVGFALDFYVKNAGLTNEQIKDTAKFADWCLKQEKKAVFYIDYKTDYNDALNVVNLNMANKNYTAQTYLTDDLLSVKRKYIQFIPITDPYVEINSTIFGDLTVDVVLDFQSFRFSNINTQSFKTVTDAVIDWYKNNFALVDLFNFDWMDRENDSFSEKLSKALPLLEVIS